MDDHYPLQTQFQRTTTPLVIAMAMLFGLVATQAFRDQHVLQAAPRTEPQRAAFESGGERSAKTLLEIKEIMLRMDTRLERIEKKISTKNQNPSQNR